MAQQDVPETEIDEEKKGNDDGAEQKESNHRLPAGAYYIIAKCSGKALGVAGGSKSKPDQQIEQFMFDGGESQIFYLYPVDDGYYLIECVCSGLYFDISGASQNDQAKCIQHAKHGRNNQQFKIEPAGKGLYKILPRHSGKALDINSKQALVQHKFHGRDNQLFEVVPYGRPIRYILWCDTDKSVAEQGHYFKAAGFIFKYFASTQELITWYMANAAKWDICGIITSSMKEKPNGHKSGIEMINYLKMIMSSMKYRHPSFGICSLSIKQGNCTHLISSNRDDIQRKLIEDIKLNQNKQHDEEKEAPKVFSKLALGMYGNNVNATLYQINVFNNSGGDAQIALFQSDPDGVFMPLIWQSAGVQNQGHGIFAWQLQWSLSYGVSIGSLLKGGVQFTGIGPQINVDPANNQINSASISYNIDAATFDIAGPSADVNLPEGTLGLQTDDSFSLSQAQSLHFCPSVCVQGQPVLAINGQPSMLYKCITHPKYYLAVVQTKVGVAVDIEGISDQSTEVEFSGGNFTVNCTLNPNGRITVDQ